MHSPGVISNILCHALTRSALAANSGAADSTFIVTPTTKFSDAYAVLGVDVAPTGTIPADLAATSTDVYDLIADGGDAAEVVSGQW